MNLRNSDPDAWWATRSNDQKHTYRAVLEIARDLVDGELLVLTYSGRSFVPALRSKPTPATKLRCARRKLMPDQTDDQWWASISAGEQQLTCHLAMMMDHLISDPGRALEMTSTGRELTARLTNDFTTAGGNPALN